MWLQMADEMYDLLDEDEVKRSRTFLSDSPHSFLDNIIKPVYDILAAVRFWFMVYILLCIPVELQFAAGLHLLFSVIFGLRSFIKLHMCHQERNRVCSCVVVLHWVMKKVWFWATLQYLHCLLIHSFISSGHALLRCVVWDFCRMQQLLEVVALFWILSASIKISEVVIGELADFFLDSGG